MAYKKKSWFIGHLLSPPLSPQPQNYEHPYSYRWWRLPLKIQTLIFVELSSPYSESWACSFDTPRIWIQTCVREAHSFAAVRPSTAKHYLPQKEQMEWYFFAPNFEIFSRNHSNSRLFLHNLPISRACGGRSRPSNHTLGPTLAFYRNLEDYEVTLKTWYAFKKRPEFVPKLSFGDFRHPTTITSKDSFFPKDLY